MSDPRFEIRRDPVLGEEVWLARTSRGLPLRLVPTTRFRETAAVVTFAYGSTDLGFTRADGGSHTSPEGVAHYLEHKLFEDEELGVFDRFAQRGAQVNAMTGFTRTTYYFTATRDVDANLKDLLRLVAKPHITPENVEKERGIIAQELRMYEDSPDYRAFFDLLRCLYVEHPVRHPVGGTVESIAAITDAELLRCFGAFYRTGNAAVAVAGPIDPAAVLALVEACELQTGNAPPSLCPADLGPPATRRTARRMQVARPRVMLGSKDGEPLVDGEARIRRQFLTRILLEHLLSPSSTRREDLAQRGLVDDSVSTSYMAERNFAFVVVGGESEDPAALEATLRDAVCTPLSMSDADLERARRRILGQYVRSFESVRGLAFAHAEQQLEGIAPFGLRERLASITRQEVEARQAELFAPERLAVAVVAP